MLKRLFVFFLLSFFSFVIVHAAAYNIQLSVSTQKSTCYTNGKILVKLGGADFNVLSQTDQVTFNVLKNGSSYKQHDLTISDLNSDSTFILDGYPAGTYTIDYSIWIGTHTEIKGSLPSFTVDPGGYLEPVVFQTLGGNTMLQGTKPSLSCKPTGRIQLEIVQGKFPYTVQVYKNGTLFRTDVFSKPMFTGTDPKSEDYKDFYNIDQLGIGSYTFVIMDSCAYQLTLAEPILVNDVNFGCITNYATYVSHSGNQLSFALKKGFFNNIKYDNYSAQWLEYRFALEGQAMGAWKDFALSDQTTVADFNSVQGKKFKFELRIKDCPSYPVCYAEVLIPGPNIPDPIPCKKAISPSVSLIPVPGSGSSDFCPCDGGTPNQIQYIKWQVKTDFNLCDSCTLPLTYKWTNLNNGLYLYERNNIGSSSMSYTSDEYPLSDDIYGNKISFKLTDASGKVHLDTIINVPPKPNAPQPTPPIPLDWIVSQNITGAVACSGDPKGSVFLKVNCGNIPDGTIVEMTQTPDNYHLTAVYDLANRKWNITPNSFSDFTVSQSVYSPFSCASILSVDFNNIFHFGNYKFNVKWKNINGNDTTTSLIYNISNTAIRFAVTQSLKFTTKKTCQGTLFYPTAQIAYWIYGDEANKKLVPVKFRVSMGNVTGYEINGGGAAVGFCNKDSILITKPGKYLIQAFYNPTGLDTPLADIEACTVSEDTINYVSQTLSFKDYYGYLCADSRGSSIRGSVTVIAKDGSGVPPYRYDLYNGNDANGRFLGTNSTGVFQDLVVSSANFFVKVEDQCLSGFSLAIPLSPVITTDAVFGDRSVCAGSSAYLQGKMIGGTNHVSYQWTSQDGFSSTNRQIFTPPIHNPTTFSLEISGLGCRIFDTITVRPVGKIDINYSDLICMGTDYDGGREYQNPIATSTLTPGLYQFSSGPFPAIKGGCDSIAHLTLLIVDNNTIMEDTMVVCDNHFPFLWQDSLFTEGTPSGIYYMSKLKNNCPYKVALRLVVNKSNTNATMLEKFICEGEEADFNGQRLTHTGFYTDTLIATTTCDSLVTMHLTVISPDKTLIVDSIFQGEAYSKKGFDYPIQKELGARFDSLLLKNRFGCDSTVLLTLKILSPAVLIPEIFTPNGDSKNAVFEIKNIERYPRNHIMIFNRWGNKVYEGRPYMNGWDGRNYFDPKLGGNLLPVGTYYYILDLGDGSEVLKGYIYLNR